MCDQTVAIPQTGKVGSLNAAVAAGILFYEAGRQRRNVRGGLIVRRTSSSEFGGKIDSSAMAFLFYRWRHLLRPAPAPRHLPFWASSLEPHRISPRSRRLMVAGASSPPSTLSSSSLFLAQLLGLRTAFRGRVRISSEVSSTHDSGRFCRCSRFIAASSPSSSFFFWMSVGFAGSVAGAAVGSLSTDG